MKRYVKSIAVMMAALLSVLACEVLCSGILGKQTKAQVKVAYNKCRQALAASFNELKSVKEEHALHLQNIADLDEQIVQLEDERMKILEAHREAHLKLVISKVERLRLQEESKPLKNNYQTLSEKIFSLEDKRQKMTTQANSLEKQAICLYNAIETAVAEGKELRKRYQSLLKCSKSNAKDKGETKVTLNKDESIKISHGKKEKPEKKS